MAKSSSYGTVFVVVGLCILFFLTLFPGVVTNADPFTQTLSNRLEPPSWNHPLGTDKFGRGVLVRIIYGARISISIGVGAVLVAGTLGVTFGLLSGYYGGAIESILMRLTDAQAAFPPIILAIMAVAVAGSSIPVLVAVLALIGWVEYARIVYNTTRSLKQREYVAAARGVGATDLRILLHHILRNSLTPIIVVGGFQIAQMILAEAALSFLGVGVQPPVPSWGTMLNAGRDVMSIAPWLIIFPGIALSFTIYTINLAAEKLRHRMEGGVVQGRR